MKTHIAMNHDLDLPDVEIENPSPTALAGMCCLMSLPVVLNCTLVFKESSHYFWPDLFLLTIVPLSVAFAILYRSSWRRELSPAKRILFMLLMSGCLYCIDIGTTIVGVLYGMVIIPVTIRLDG